MTISDSECCSGTWYRFVLLYGTFYKVWLWSGLFGLESDAWLKVWKLLNLRELQLIIWSLICRCDFIVCVWKFWIGSNSVYEIFGMIERGPGVARGEFYHPKLVEDSRFICWCLVFIAFEGGASRSQWRIWSWGGFFFVFALGKSRWRRLVEVWFAFALRGPRSWRRFRSWEFWPSGSRRLDRIRDRLDMLGIMFVGVRPRSRKEILGKAFLCFTNARHGPHLRSVYLGGLF